MLLEKVQRSIRQNELILPGDRGLVAFSGGQDSLCLLHLLTRLRRPMELGFEAAIVDHGLSPGSAALAGQAASRARELGVDAVILRAVLARGPGNVQQAAREQRLRLLQERAESEGHRWVALGHTATDQAETVVMRAIRGSGPRGLAAMSAQRGVFVRPLLEVTREEVNRYLAEHRLVPVLDPSNATGAYHRNRVRHQLLPMLQQENPKVVQALCRLALCCREENEALEALAADAVQRASIEEARALEVSVLAELPRGLLHRALRKAYEEAAGPGPRLQRRHLEALARLLRSADGTRWADLPGVRAERRYHKLFLRADGHRGAAAPGFEPVEIAGPGTVRLSDGRTLRVGKGCSDPAPGLGLDLDRARFPLVVRPWAAGDRIAVGEGASRKVARVLIDAKVPRELRPRVPLVVAGGVVVLVVGIRAAHGYGGGEGVVQLVGGNAV